MIVKVQLAIADVSLRQSLCALLQQEPDMVVLPSTPSSDDVGVDLVLVDGDSRAAPADDLIRSLKKTQPRTRAIILVAQATAESIQAALGAGACGVVEKRQPPRELLGALRVVAQGGSYLCLTAGLDWRPSPR
jgi:DNA-binding NarL/FixJ family response regulator